MTTRQVGLLLFGIALILSISAAQILMTLLLLEWMVRSVRSGAFKKFHLSFTGWFLILFVASIGFSTWLNHSAPLRKVFSTHNAILLFFLFAAAYDSTELMSLVKGLVIGGLVAGLVGLVQVSSGINYLPSEKMYAAPDFVSTWPRGLLRYISLNNGRPMGTRGHALTYAESFIPVFFLLATGLFYRLFSKKEALKQMWKEAVAFLIVALGILLAQGRAVWLACLVGLVVMVFSQPARIRLICLVSCLLIGGTVLTFSSHVRGRLFSIFNASAGSASDQISKTMRYSIWDQAINRIKQRPVWGSGIKGTTINVKDPYSDQVWVWSEVHNSYLQNALEGGGVAVVLAVCFIGLLFKAMIKMEPPASWFFLSTTLAFLIAGLTESWTHDKEIAMLFFTMAGVSQQLLKKNETK